MTEIQQAKDSILFLGDVVLDHPYPVEFSHPKIIFNLEGPLSGGPQPRNKTWNLCVKDCYLDAVFHPLPSAVSLANNHIMDYGEEALDATCAKLDQLGIQYFGVGNGATAFGNPLILTCGTKRIGILGYSSGDIGAQLGDEKKNGAAPLRLETVAEDMLRLRQKKVDSIIVYPHWGIEHITLPSPEIVLFAHQLIEMGADLIVGTHAHCMQAYEIFAGKPIFYGLGNFIFPSRPLPGYYDESGMPTKFGNIVLLQQQQLSLGIEYFPEHGEVRQHFYRFTGKRVINCNGSLENISELTNDFQHYSQLFASRYQKDLFLYRLYSFIKCPKPSRILRFLNRET